MRRRAPALLAFLVLSAACASFAEKDPTVEPDSDGGAVDGAAAADADGGVIDGAVAEGGDGSSELCPVGVGPSMAVVEVLPGRAICVDRTEVTSAQYAAFRGKPYDAAVEARIPAPCKAVPLDAIDQRGDLPRVDVSFCSAARFCVSQGKRLCGALEDGGPIAFVKEAGVPDPPLEWESACANGAERSYYPWGTTDPAGAVASKCHTRSYDPDASAPRPVEAEPTCGPGDGGPVDMIGNVWEWVNARRDIPDGASYTLVRGGAYDGPTVGNGCKTGHGRDGAYGTYASGWPTIGFRCCADPKW